MNKKYIKMVSCLLGLALFSILVFSSSITVSAQTPVTVTTVLSTGAGRLDWSHSGNNLITFDRLGADNFYDVYTMTSGGASIVCLTCNKAALAPNKHIGNPAWHPSGSYIVFQAQNDYFGLGSITDYFANPGSGINNDLWVMNANGTQFWKLVDVPNALGGILHPHFSRNGNKLLWSQRVSASGGSAGTWDLRVADFSVTSGSPSISNIVSYQPGQQVSFYESDEFIAYDSKIMFTGSLEPNQSFEGGDVYIMDLATQQVTNLTNTMGDWDEHAHMNPATGKIAWMTSRGYVNANGPPTDFWIMNLDGTNKNKLTHFNEAGYPEYMNGQMVISADNSWNSTGTSLMAYLILNLSTGDSRIVRIDLPTPTPTPSPTPRPDTISPAISSVAVSNLTQFAATINWTTNELADGQVEFCLTYSRCGNNTPVVADLSTTHIINLSGLTPNTLYYYWVKSKDAAGNLAQSYARHFRTLSIPDTIAPTVSIMAPLNGANISGTILVTATVQDNVGVAGVKFYRDADILVRYEDTYPPYNAYLYSSNLTQGPHTIYALARDTGGNMTKSSLVTISVIPPPDTTPPYISSVTVTNITQFAADVNWITNEPADGQIAFCTTYLVGCTNSTPLVTPLTTSHVLNLSGLTPGTYYYMWIKSKDAAGNLKTYYRSFRTAL